MEQVLKVLVDAVAADPAARTVGVAELQLLPRLVDQQTATGPVAEALRQVVRDLLGIASLPGAPILRHISRYGGYPFVQSKRVGIRHSIFSLWTFQ